MGIPRIISIVTMLVTAQSSLLPHRHHHQEMTTLFSLISNPKESVLGFDSYEAMNLVFPTPAEQIQYFSYYGVLFDEKDGHHVIAEIHWAGQQLTEFDWTALSDLESLRLLDLGRNAISGSIDWSQLPMNLQELNLSFNALTGSVDVIALAKCKRLEIVDLSFNWFSGSIDVTALDLLPYLQRLDLRINRGIKRPESLPMHVFVTETF